MTIWSSKGVLAALSLFALTGCGAGPGMDIAGTLSALKVRETKPFSQVKMMRGAITLHAPHGFCIDGRSLRQRFALMARCDTLGAPLAAAGAPLGLITVSVSEATAGGGVPSPDAIAAALALEGVDKAESSGGSITFQATGSAPTEAVSNRHWRGAAMVGDHVLSMAIYGPENSSIVSGEGREILKSLIASSQLEGE